MSRAEGRTAAVYQTAVYIRLSREDGDKAESDSVGNQRKLLMEFLNSDPDLSLASEYVDDGWSGTSFRRPAFEQMIRDIEAGLVDCVVVKDLSRLGRDYIDTGRLLERYFPERGVRFISLADGIDSRKQEYDMLLPIKNIFNEQYARDISRKIHAVVRTKQKAGEFIGAFACYGYRKSPSDKNRLVVDERAAEVVRMIFRLFLEGKGKNTIARMLNARGIPCPSEYKRLNGERYRNGGCRSGQSCWTYSTVNKILHSEMYLGNMVQGRRFQRMRGKVRQVERENWIVVEGTHEAIIDRQVWEQTRKLLKSRYAPFQPAAGENIFAGFIRCGDCGRAMVRKGRDRYLCGTYVRAGKACCSGHGVKRQELEEIVLAELARAVEEEQKRGSLAELFERAEKRRTKQGTGTVTEKRGGRKKAEWQTDWPWEQDERAENGQKEAGNGDKEEEYRPLAGVSGILVRRGDSSMRKLLAEMAEELLIFEDGSVELVCLYGDIREEAAQPSPSSWRQ